MARPILADETRPVNTEEYWLIILAGVVDNLIPRPLHEGGVDRNHWSTTTHRDSSCGGHRMLLRNPDIVEAIWIRLCECVKARPSGHPSCDGNDAAIVCGVLALVADALIRPESKRKEAP